MDRDAEIRKLVPFLMRATHCTREVAIEWLCKLSADHRIVLYSMRALEKLNRPIGRKRRKVDIKHCATPPSLHQEAWSKPR